MSSFSCSSTTTMLPAQITYNSTRFTLVDAHIDRNWTTSQKRVFEETYISTKLSAISETTQLCTYNPMTNSYCIFDKHAEISLFAISMLPIYVEYIPSSTQDFAFCSQIQRHGETKIRAMSTSLYSSITAAIVANSKQYYQISADFLTGDELVPTFSVKVLTSAHT